MRGYRISIFRHGRTEAGDKGIYIGKTDYSLSDEGIAELEKAKSSFVYPLVDAVYMSPLKRAVQSAEILFPYDKKVIADGLSELNFGEFEGKSADELIERDDFKNWLKDGLNFPPPNGESVLELTERSLAAINAVFHEMMDKDYEHCAIVTHSGVMANILSCFGIPKISPTELVSEPGEGFEIMFTAQLWQRSNAFEILGRTPYIK